MIITGKTYLILFLVLCGSGAAWAIELSPTQGQIQHALQEGRVAAQARVLPNELYAWFGSVEEFEPKGFLMTKMNGLTVLAAHFALRGEEPSQGEVARILDEESMLVSVILFGTTPTFAKYSYLVLKQSEKLVKPVKVRFDGVANRTSMWPHSPRYTAKVIANFRYEDFDPQAPTTVIVFPSEGGERSFEFDFSQVP